MDDTCPQPVSLTLRACRIKAVGLLSGSAAFVAGGIWMFTAGHWVGVLIAGFFGLGVLVALVQLLPGSSYLRVDETGFTHCTFFRERFVPWSAVDEFFVLTIGKGFGRHKMVGLNFRPTYEGLPTGRRLSRAIVGCDGGLPDTYGKSAEELAVFLDTCLDAFRHEGPPEQPTD
jgi:hypothetical protein